MIFLCLILLFSLTGARAQGECDYPPLSTCAPCEGGLTSLTLEYTGGGVPVAVAAVDGEGNTLPGGIDVLTNVITINSLAPTEPFRGGSVTVTVLALLGAVLAEQTIVTSCATPVYVGSVFGSFKVLSGTSLSGGPVCCSPDIMDQTPPVFTTPCPGNIQLFTAAGSCTAFTSWSPPAATDNCGSVSVVGSHDHTGTTFNLGITTVTYTATDDYNNTAVCSFTSCVSDKEVNVNGSCSYVVQDYTGEASATDNCDNDVMITQSPVMGTLLTGAGPHLITVIATDDAGNTDSFSGVACIRFSYKDYSCKGRAIGGCIVELQ